MLTEVASGLLFPEGPIAMDDGSVVLVEMFGPRLTRIRPDGSRHTIAEIPGGPNGAAIGPDGAVYVCNNGGCFTPMKVRERLMPGHFDEGRYLGGSIQRVDLATGEVSDLYTSCDGERLQAPNDLVFDAHGGFYFTDHGTRGSLRFPRATWLWKLVRRVVFGDYSSRPDDLTSVYYAKADGSHIERVVEGVHGPNGVGISPDGTFLYWAETFNGRICRRTITGPGTLLAGEPNHVVCTLPGVDGFDSLAIDSAGNVCAARLVNGGITTIAPSGEVLEHLPTQDLVTTNICFGGDDLRTAYITLASTGRLVSTRWPRPGLALGYPASGAPGSPRALGRRS